MKSVSDKYPNWYKIKIPNDLRIHISHLISNDVPSTFGGRFSFKFDNIFVRKNKGDKKHKKGISFNAYSYFIVKRTEDMCFFKIIVKGKNDILSLDLENLIYSYHHYDKKLYCITNESCPQCDGWVNCDYYGKTLCERSLTDVCTCIKLKSEGPLSYNHCCKLKDKCYEYIDSIKNLIPLREPHKVIEKDDKINGNEYYWIIKKIRSSKVRLCNTDSYYIFVRMSYLPKELIKMITIFACN